MAKKALVIGFGVSGRGSAKLLLSQGFSVVAADRNAAKLQGDGVELVLDDPEMSLEGISLAVISPGIDPLHPLVQKIRKMGIETVGEIELGFRYLPNDRIIGVTGTNGKTTTVLLTEHILKASGLRAIALGNVGIALSQYALHPDPEEMLIVELSSFQLEALETKPRFAAALILNITPNHLNRHASMREYADAKLKVGSCLKEGGAFFVSDQVAKNFEVKYPFLTIFDREPFPTENQVQLGMAERPNIAAAKALCSFCGVSEMSFDLALKTFRKPPHRIEWVAEIDQVAYYNDSKASNVEAVLHAVSLFSTPIVLIAGGVDKGASYCPWIEPFRSRVKQLIVFGEASLKMERELSRDVPLKRVQTLYEAFEEAKAAACSGDTVLLSPGCSSYDQFANYEERGDAFKKMVMGWIGKRR